MCLDLWILMIQSKLKESSEKLLVDTVRQINEPLILVAHTSSVLFKNIIHINDAHEVLTIYLKLYLLY